MSLVLNNLINKINNRLDAADSDGTSFSTLDLQRLSRLNNKINGEVPLGTIQYRSLGHIPPAEDSAGLGQIVFVKDEQLDSDGRYYYRAASAWTHLITGADSDENKLIDSDRLRAGGGSSQPLQIQYNIRGQDNGYHVGGWNITNSYIGKFPFASDANSANITATLLAARGYNANANSETDGYIVGGYNPGATWPGAAISGGVKPAKFPFANEDAMTNTSVTQLSTVDDLWLAGATNSDTHVYTAGGVAPGSGGNINVISKFPTASEDTQSDVGDLATASGYHGPQHQSSGTDGYVAGGSPSSNPIQKFSFASDANATTITATAGGGTSGATGSSSETHGYHYAQHPSSTAIIKFSFANDTEASSQAGNHVHTSKSYLGGVSSTENGYAFGGNSPTNLITKYSHTTDADATDIADMSYSAHGVGGNQS